ncbi:endo-alpha-N-acetylgalactosaminidase family protein [Kribbella deserti]|uniref:Endo-alpha-N-acetylgalactosaminidase family protein n=1 Tax=Kribbella deserti TaxID=1926257 RepID=A0ABV6QEC1_9ACTN
MTIPLRPAALAATLALAGAGLAVPAQADTTDVLVLRSPQLTVEVGTDFPRVIGYADNATGKTLGGQPNAISTVTVNGGPRTARLLADPAVSADQTKVSYRLGFDALPGVELDASLALTGRVTTFRVDAVRDTETSRVHTLDIPEHNLVSVASTDAGATTAFTTLDPDSTRTADRITPVTTSTAAEASPTGAAYAFVNTAGLAAGIESNSVYDKPSGQSVDDGARFWHQARKAADGTVRVGVWSGQWTYRADTSPYTEPLPWAKVVVTPDANADNTVDWQDGAIAFRSIMTKPTGGELTKDRVITHIPFNFASQATHPFLRTLDDVKRISLATDGLGQLAVLKGYGSEGHDSAHPDYGGNYNTRAGGLKDLNTLLAKGKEWNAAFGVHVNATESYPEANAFSEDLVDKSAKGWNWLNQSYYIKQRPDLASGNIIKRFQQLRDETDKNLQSLYIDVYYQSGWLADGLARRLGDQGWQIATEWSDRFERSSLWSHWANDLNYGGATNKGLNSKIIRFARNHEKDVWNNDPILGQSSLVEFEGWTGEVDWNEFYANIWQRNLPTKWLQHHQITNWNGNEITFTDGVRGAVANGKRSLYVGNAKVLDGDKYLLPWKGQKLYHYNPEGGLTAWRVSLPGVSRLNVYKLTDNGRVKVGAVSVRNGVATIDADAGQPYVLYPATAPTQPAADWGHGSKLKDPGFNATGLTAWSPTGFTRIDELENGQHVAAFGPGTAALKQRITGLIKGKTYSASAWIEVEPGKTRPVTLSVDGSAVKVSRSSLQNRVAADDKHGTYFQRARVTFVAGGNSALLTIAAADGDARVRVDDVRVVETTRVAVEGFEDVDQGWGPFVKGDAGGTTDPRTSLARKHAPYTQAGWNGKLVDDVITGDWSLKSHEENAGLVYRTAPWTVGFTPGHKYRVSFAHENGRAGQYTWVHGVDRVVDGKPKSIEVNATPMPEQRTPKTFSQEFVAGCGGDYWVGLRKLSSGGDQADFILDDFTVTDLGPSTEAPSCTTLSLSGPDLNNLVPGEAGTVVSTFTNNDITPATNVELGLTAPTDWTVTPTGPATHATVAPGAKVTTTWTITPPATTAAGRYPLVATSNKGPAFTIDATVLPPGTIPQSRIKVVDVSSDDPGTDGPASAALDGNPSTLWHTAWSAVPTPATYPHHITLDLGTTYQVDGFGYLPRQTGTNGMFKGYELYVSTDGQNWGTPVKTGEFPNSRELQRLTFPAKPGRYLKFVGTSSLNGAPFGAAAELTPHGTR